MTPTPSAGTAACSGLIAYWNFDGTPATLTDSIGSDNGVISGATQNQTGKINQSYYFNGSSAVILNFSNLNLEPTVNAMSFSAWVNIASSTTGIIIAKADGDSTTTRQYSLYANGTYLAVYCGGGGLVATSTTAICTGAWVHIVVTLPTSGTGYIYINGTQDATTIPSLSDTTNNDIPLIGARWDSTGSTGGFAAQLTGYIDEVGVWGRVLSAAEASYLYNSGSGRQCTSDIRLKKDIKLIGKSDYGINIYQFRYINSQNTPGLFRGVMAQELLGTKFENAVVMVPDNKYYMVDYSKIDVKFEKISPF